MTSRGQIWHILNRYEGHVSGGIWSEVIRQKTPGIRHGRSIVDSGERWQICFQLFPKQWHPAAVIRIMLEWANAEVVLCDDTDNVSNMAAKHPKIHRKRWMHNRSKVPQSHDDQPQHPSITMFRNKSTKLESKLHQIEQFDNIKVVNFTNITDFLNGNSISEP
jgi:hypothetical protein